MNREALRRLDKEALIDLILAQAEAIGALTKQVEVLTARVVELEAKLGGPPKTPDNSSLPPSKGQKPSGAAAPKPKGPRPNIRVTRGHSAQMRRLGPPVAHRLSTASTNEMAVFYT
jgi:hypothetical protein